MRRFLPVLALLASLAFTPAPAAELGVNARPEEVGLSSEQLERLTQELRAGVEKGLAPGAVVLISRYGKVAYFQTIGVLDPDSKKPMTADALFRIYSMTKPITSIAAMMLVKDGKMALNDPVAKYLSEFKDVKVGVEKPGADGQPTLDLVAPRRPMTIQDLLRHTSGLTYGVFGNNLVKKAYRDSGLLSGDFDNAEFSQRIAKLPLMFHPGAQWEYSHATDVLGRVVEVVSGKSLLAFMKERIFDPLGMKDTTFYVADASRHGRIAEPFKEDRSIGTNVEMFDPRKPTRYESGGGGLMSTMADYTRFAEMLVNGGILDGKTYVGPKTLAYMASDHVGAISKGSLYLPGDGYGFGLGFAVRTDNGLANIPGSVGDYHWSGAGGTTFWVDPREGMFAILMMQGAKHRVHFRSVLRNVLYGAIQR